MPFKSKKQKRLFGACMNDEFRAKRRRAGQPCPSKSTIRKMFKDSKKSGTKRGRKKK